MSDSIIFHGVRNDSLYSYLKAIGILRLVSSHCQPTVMAAWRDGALELVGIERAELEQFFLDAYQPTPILNPWNSGAGFDAKSRQQEAGKTLDRVAAEAKRWPAYVAALEAARAIAAAFDGIEGDNRKRDMLLQLRARSSDAALEWLDAAVLIGGTKLGFPAVLGTGGNDGRLDFSINFAQRALDVAGSRPVAQRRGLLLDALDATATASLVRGTFGQYRLGAGDHLNPWDFVLAIEGAIAFAGSVSRRFPADSDRPAAPFQFEAIAAGYAAASKDEPTRGELWLPAWRGRATYQAVRRMLRAGRVELLDDRHAAADSKMLVASRASDSIAAVAAAQTYGVASGIESFARVVIAQRNGLAFGATYAGRIPVNDRPEMAAFSREVRTWVQRAARAELGATGRKALRDYQEGMIAYASRPRSEAFQDLLASLAELDDALPFSRGDHRPLPFLSTDIHGAIDAMLTAECADGGTLEHRVARALTSIGHRRRRHRLRYRIGHVMFDDAKGAVYNRQQRYVWLADVRDTLVRLFERSVRDAAQEPRDLDDGFAARFNGSWAVDLEDLARILAGGADWQRIKTLVRAYSIVEPYVSPRGMATEPNGAIAANASAKRRKLVVPAHFSALKTLVDGWHADELKGAAAIANATYLDAETASQLVAGLTPRALAGAYRRLRSAGMAVRDFRAASIEDTSTFVAALTIPIKAGTRRALRNRLLLEPSKLSHDDDRTDDTSTHDNAEETT